MSPFEKACWAWLQQLPMDWESHLGSDAVALLNGGFKLELEGATMTVSTDAELAKRLRARLGAGA